MRGRSGRSQVRRLAALALAILVIPAILSIDSAVRGQPIVQGEPSPRTVVAPDLIRIVDAEATAQARDEAADLVEPVLVSDDEAPAAIVRRVRESFAAARSVRESSASEAPLGTEAQVEALAGRLAMLDREGLRRLAQLSDSELTQVANEAIGIAQLYARESVRADRVEDVADRLLRIELAVRPLPEGVGESIVAPIVRDALRPTVREDQQATATARERAAAAVAPVETTYARGETIVREGQVVTELEFEALRSRNLEGSLPWRSLAEAIAVACLLTAAVAGYLRAAQVRVWRSSRLLLVLSVLMTLAAVGLEVVDLLPVEARSAWSFAVPIGAVAMLIAILVNHTVAVLMAAPLAALITLALPGEPALLVFAVVISLGSVPLVTQLSARGDLRRAALRSTLGYSGVAAVCALTFGEPEQVHVAAAAGLVSGVLTAVIVNGSLPFFESLFGVCTATSLLDLADRNHPLLRELEQRAIGTYNHSLVVSTMVERAAREIGANPLLAGVTALYHDIGKLRRPYFFVENQFGMANPHDDLDPETSTAIIHAHVADGVAMARSHRLPPEVVEGIATHHGTTFVSYFHGKALAAAGPDGRVESEQYRYPGPKPSTRETALLMLADCCESAARAKAHANRNLSQPDLKAIVDRLLAQRVEDGQLDDCTLTFRDLMVVQSSFIETLVGVYHPRIAYPEPPEQTASGELPRLPAGERAATGADATRTGS